MGKAGATGRSITWTGGDWIEGNPPLLGAANHAVWLSSVVFDGARAFDGLAPDLDRHCARVVESARALGMEPTHDGPAVEAIARAGIRRFAPGTALYVKPVYYAEDGFITPDPASTRLAVCLFEAPMPPADGFSACLSSFRRPSRDAAPTHAKAACLYPNVARAVAEANAKGFDTAVMLDPNGNLAEFAYTNLFFANDGVVHTPALNGTFLAGITRGRVIGLLREAGIEVVEGAYRFADLLAADEVFATGNYFKLGPCTRLDSRELPIGPLFRRARDLYFAFAATCPVG